MTEHASTPAQPARSFTAPLIVWLIIQLIPLILAAARVPLAAGMEQPLERLAVAEMVVAQIAFASMLFPFLLRDWRSTAVIVATSWPFMQLSGLLAPVETSHWIAAACGSTAWIVSLACWREVLRSRPAAQQIAVAIITVIALGGAILWYLNAEFSRSTLSPSARAALFGPIIATLSLLKNPSVFPAWISLGACLVVSLFAIAFSRAMHRSRD